MVKRDINKNNFKMVSAARRKFLFLKTFSEN